MTSNPPPSDPTPETLRLALAEAALVIASFRWRLRAAGYPFREPSNVDATIARIDALVHPEEMQRAKTKAQCVTYPT